jgi:hypothetical protein
MQRRGRKSPKCQTNFERILIHAEMTMSDEFVLPSADTSAAFDQKSLHACLNDHVNLGSYQDGVGQHS